MATAAATQEPIRSPNGPSLALIGDGSGRSGLFIGYLVGAAIMIIGGIVELLIGIDAEGKSLEDITKPLTAADT